MSGDSNLGRQVWAHARELPRFRANDLVEALGISGGSARNFVRRWESDGRIVVAHRERHNRWFVARERMTETGAPAPLPEASPRANMWRTMRHLPSFSALDLAAHSSAGGVAVTERAAREYCQQLHASGHLRIVDKAKPGRRPARFRLIENSGPLPPEVRRVLTVYDPNTEAHAVIEPGRST